MCRLSLTQCLCLPYLLIRSGAQANVGAHPVHRLPQRASTHQPVPETTPVLVGRLEGHPGQQEAVRTLWHHLHTFRVGERTEETLVSGCQNLSFEKEKGKKKKKEKKRRERLVISQIHNNIQGRFTKQTLVALCWERTFTCSTTRGRSETEGEDVDNPASTPLLL